MRRTPGLVATGIALAVMVAASVWTYGDLPERVATHFDAAGNPDDWSSRTAAVLVTPLITLGTALLLAFLPAIEPRKRNLQRSAKVYNAAWIGAMVVLTVAHLGILFNASGMDFPFLRLLIVAIGGLFVVIGNYLGKTRSNWFAGVRTPWTVSD